MLTLISKAIATGPLFRALARAESLPLEEGCERCKRGVRRV